MIRYDNYDNNNNYGGCECPLHKVFNAAIVNKDVGQTVHWGLKFTL